MGNLLAASQSDADADVRSLCLQLAGWRAARDPSESERLHVLHIARALAISDTDLKVREMAVSVARRLGSDGPPSQSSTVRELPGTR